MNTNYMKASVRRLIKGFPSWRGIGPLWLSYIQTAGCVLGFTCRQVDWGDVHTTTGCNWSTQIAFIIIQTTVRFAYTQCKCNQFQPFWVYLLCTHDRFPNTNELDSISSPWFCAHTSESDLWNTAESYRPRRIDSNCFIPCVQCKPVVFGFNSVYFPCVYMA